MNEQTGSSRERHEASTASLVLVIAVLLGVALLVALPTAPLAELLGPNAHHGLSAALHGLTAFLFLFVATIALYLGWRLFIGRIHAFLDLQLVTVVSATLSFITVLFGNWVYIYYREPSGAREWLTQNAPEVHKIFFEFKEFMALFTLPLGVAAAFILWRYGSEVLDRPWLRYSVAVLIALVWFYLVVAFGLGAAVTKIKPV